MAATEPEKRRDIQRNGRNFHSRTLLPVLFLKRPEFQFLLHYPVSGFPAADILVLVAAAHVGKTPFFERFKCHGCGVMVAGKKIAGFMRQALPALEPKRLGSQFQRPAMDKEHPAIHPLHGHIVEDGKEGGIPELLVTVRACGIAPADQKPVKVGMVMVPEDGYEPVFPGQGMDLLKSLLGTITAMEEIAEIDEGINQTKCFAELWGLNACCKCPDCC